MSQQFSLTIPAAAGGRPGLKNLNVGGLWIVCLVASGPLRVAVDSVDHGRLQTGGSRGAFATRFRRVTLYNDSAAIITTTVDVGDEELKPNTPQGDSSTIPVELQMTEATPTQFLKTSTAAAAPVALTAVETLFRKATVMAKKSLDGTVNVGDVRIGASATASQQPYLMAPGDEIVLQPAFGQNWNFQDWYLDVDTNADGVVVIFS
jgi:hypothetical protein